MKSFCLDYVFLNAIFGIFLARITLCSARMDNCYLRVGQAQRCLPPFVNAAYGKTVISSDTCGNPPEQYCLQTGATGVTKSCHICNNNVSSQAHGAVFLTDLHNRDISTWWQSRTMLYNVQYPNMVNLTLNLNKAFDITYVRLLFHTSRPESFAIYKKKCEECDWQPMQYYSGSCFSTYGIDNKEIVTSEDEQKALCTDDYSDISPLTGGNVAFSTLESRPSAYNFDRSPVLQDWVKAVAIRITLNRINTFGDEVFQDPKILKSYYYGISDLSIGGRCACNGHSSECFVGPNSVIQCRCEHNTAGRDCEKCAPLFNDRPWSRGSRDNPGECKACDCNGKAASCYLDMDLYRSTGRGGHCINCTDNTDGPNCAYCKPNYFRDANGNCVSCECNTLGSYSQQCDLSGLCRCKFGVGGERCDRCLDDHYDLSESGCRLCECSIAGTVPGTVCDAVSGACVCKLNVEGQMCDRCKPATMNMKEDNPYGCTSCFCHGHSSVCEVSPDYTVAYIISEFNDGKDGWEGRNLLDMPQPVHHSSGSINMDPATDEPTYFSAPHNFLGEQRFSYNQFLEFELRVVETVGSVEYGSGTDENNIHLLNPLQEDLIFEGDGFRVSTKITSQENPTLTDEFQVYRFRLHEAAGFYPSLSAVEFQRILNNLKKIYISSSYGRDSVAYLDNVQMKTVEYRGAGPPADWVERCDSDGYTGNFSEMCAPGFTRDPPNGGVYAPCVPCNCNGHSTFCDSENGVCECSHNTMGDNCELCADGYYFGQDESKRGTPQECQPCPCPLQSTCIVLEAGEVVCTNCPPGHAGPQCEICMDGWFGEPRGRGPCLQCICNKNIDINAVMNCNRTTGECLKCIHNTTGFHCESCLPGYFGRAVTNNPDERCRLCGCDTLGSQHVTACNELSGQCQCRPFVEGRRCDRCRSGYWNIHSGEGCDSCNCHPVGSGTGECDQETGQCDCLPGVTGERCDRCQPYHYRLTQDGCTACNCNRDGSKSLECDEDGRCVCKDGVLGYKCNQCQENFYDLVNGCKECPTCYSLVQDSILVHRDEVGRLETVIENIGDQPLHNNSRDNIEFKNALSSLNLTVYRFQILSKEKQKEENSLTRQLEEYSERLQEMIMKLAGTENNIDHCNETVQEAVIAKSESKEETKETKEILATAERKLNEAMMNLQAAQRSAQDSLNKENNMTKLAHEAQALAESQEKESEEIGNTADKAKEESKRALGLIQESIDLLETLMSKLENLIESESKLSAAQQLRNELLTQTTEVKNRTKAAKMQSTKLFTETLKLTVPDVNTELLVGRSQDILTASDALISDLNFLEKQYFEKKTELDTEKEKALGNFNIARNSQNSVDKLLAQVEDLQNQFSRTVGRGNSSYVIVNNTLTSLRSFDELINGNRDAAREALANVASIQAKIDEAVATTADTKETLGDAKAVASEAKSKAELALSRSKQIKADSETIKESAEESHNEAYDVSEAVTDLTETIRDFDDRLRDAEDQVSQDERDVNMVKQTASQVSTAVQKTTDRIDHVLRQLRQLLRRLHDMDDDIDNDTIGGLEVMYLELKTAVDAQDVEATLRQLRKQVSRQQRFIRHSNAEINTLREDVDNLADIFDTLPKECANPANNEQP